MRCRGVLLLSLVSCSSPPRVIGSPVGSTPDSSGSAAAAPTYPPALVLQAVALPHATVAYPEPWKGSAMSHDGALVALWGPELTLLSAADGSVRAQFPGCATAATFTPKDDGMIVVGCPRKGDGVSGSAGAGADTEVLSWDLASNTTRSLTRGAFTDVRLTVDGTAAILRGRDVAVVWSLADGVARATFTLPGAEEIVVANTGDRALALKDRVHTLFAPDPTTVTAVSYPSECSADLRFVGNTTREGKLLIRRIDDGALVSEARLDRPHVLAFDDGSERYAASVWEGDTARLAVLSRAGKVQCMTKGDAFDATRVEWSSDGARLAALSTRARGRAEWAILDARTCERVPTSRPVDYRSSRPVFNGELQGAFVYVDPDSEGGAAKLAILAAIPAAQTEKPGTLFDVAAPPMLAPRSGAAVAIRTADWKTFAFEPSTETLSPLPDARPVESLGGTLSATGASGAVVTAHATLQKGLSGDLFLLAADGHKTVLAQSAPFTADAATDVHYFGCAASRTGRFVSCGRVNLTDGQRVAIWDQTGRRVLEHAGTFVELSWDEKRVLITSFTEGGCILVDLETGKELARSTTAPDYEVSLSADGKLVAWSARGILDAATGATLLPDTFGFGPWLVGTHRIFQRRGSISGRRDHERAFGPMDVRDVDSNEVKSALDDDAEILEQTSDGSRFLSRNEVDLVRVRDATTFKVLAEAIGYEHVTLSADGAFLFMQGAGAMVVRRIADGAELLQVPPSKLGERGLSFTRSGLYDGGDAAIATLQYREGDVRTGKLVPVTVERPGDRRPGLAAAFFAGKSIEPRP